MTFPLLLLSKAEPIQWLVASSEGGRSVEMFRDKAGRPAGRPAGRFTYGGFWVERRTSPAVS